MPVVNDNLRKLAEVNYDFITLGTGSAQVYVSQYWKEISLISLSSDRRLIDRARTQYSSAPSLRS